MGSSRRNTLTDEASASGLELAMSDVAAAMSDPSRVAMLCALMDGRA
ncbi:Transcriptional regulator, ArsR family [Cronobacter dublinensis 1210]|uniref:Transcriptional regulator, ArsR family n=2 Tax=Cronobacter dublinensis TaxID=413497 RepID=A0ABP1WA89_9ENTR|nr:Transcriptional regulator, ArsR family [Cronobacter dublinensis 1210]